MREMPKTQSREKDGGGKRGTEESRSGKQQSTRVFSPIDTGHKKRVENKERSLQKLVLHRASSYF